MRVFFQKFIVFASQLLYTVGEIFETYPKIRRSKVLQNSRLSPRLCWDSAFAANLSSLPASISDSI